MLVQIYEVTSAEEASALTKLGVDHIGVLVGKGEFPREQWYSTRNPFLSHRATTESQTCFSWIVTDQVTRKSAR